LNPLDDPATGRAVLAERAALSELEGGCIIPMAAWAWDVEGQGAVEGRPEVSRSELAIDAVLLDPDGRERVIVSLRGLHDDPCGLGRRAPHVLREREAEALLARVRQSDQPRSGLTAPSVSVC
jgi:hydroxymethylbilane synthase